MCTFVITYTDGSWFKCLHVNSATYGTPSGNRTVQENELLTHFFPVGRSLWLHSNSGNHCVNGDGIRHIEILAE